MTNTPTLVHCDGDTLSFDCPGCGNIHTVRVGDGPGPRWQYSGDAERPSLQPSILTTSGHHTPGHRSAECWCTYEARHGQPPPFTCFVCHLYVETGQLRYLSDCTHALAGKTVPMVPWD